MSTFNLMFGFSLPAGPPYHWEPTPGRCYDCLKCRRPHCEASAPGLYRAHESYQAPTTTNPTRRD